jgi:hypothetical protein
MAGGLTLTLATVAFGAGWDAEHTLGIRFKGDSMVELCGSIL